MINQKEFDELKPGDQVIIEPGKIVAEVKLAPTGPLKDMVKLKALSGKLPWSCPYFYRREIFKLKHMETMEFFSIVLDEKQLSEAKLLWNTVSFDGLMPEEITILNFKASKDSTQANIAINGGMVEDVIFKFSGEIKSNEFLKKLRSFIAEKYIAQNDTKETPIQAEPLEHDNISEADAKILDGAAMMADLNQKEILIKNGFVRGAIIKRCPDEWNCSYGIFTGMFYDSEGGTVGLNFTDGQQFHQDYCTLVDDVNKEILRMASAEKDRIMSNAELFTRVIDEGINVIIYGG